MTLQVKEQHLCQGSSACLHVLIGGRRQNFMMTADGPAEADAERAVRAASKIAEAAVSKAVQAAAMAGLEYMPPPDMQLDTPRVAKVTTTTSPAW
jgi:hypothetical protein